MDFLEYKVKFVKKALEAGYSEVEIDQYLTYAKVLLDKKLPLIYNTSHLAALTGYSTRYITRAALYPKSFYRTFKIKKKNGKMREINEPLPSLKEIQLWINKNILLNIKPNKFAKAYIKKTNILDNVKYHKRKKYVFNLDLVNFFPSISTKTVEMFFKKLGYSDNLSNLLAKLCCFGDGLAQGAPTSPALSNHILYEFDDLLGSFAVENNLRYTRYADDLTFSFNDEFDVSIIEEKVINTLDKTVLYSKLTVNREKTKLLRQNDRQIVTGVVVNDKTQVPSSYRKQIRQEIYYIRKFGLSNHLNRLNEVRYNYLYHLLGKINFVLLVNSEDKEMKEYRNAIKMLISNRPT
ncbi:Retron-type reverse transcriptase [Sphingobacterium spiritivorum]|uniref:RNA-directed DNA polymerase n=1 Tax=Sphingobacterium spiritivorum TaxID=258 RepID=A0A380CTE0_SPHSI|nr:retron St85 family RNA-directed DNA polymerase [Sphingobacterium spiritivorum]SUJ28691.1 Retron-type reverse transcriptase [Sphingobacterium spiritivorum]